MPPVMGWVFVVIQGVKGVTHTLVSNPSIVPHRINPINSLVSSGWTSVKSHAGLLLVPTRVNEHSFYSPQERLTQQGACISTRQGVPGQISYHGTRTPFQRRAVHDGCLQHTCWVCSYLPGKGWGLRWEKSHFNP